MPWIGELSFARWVDIALSEIKIRGYLPNIDNATD